MGALCSAAGAKESCWREHAASRQDDESGEDEKEPKESAAKKQPEPPVAVSSGEPEGSGGQREAKRGKKRGGAEEVFERIADKQKKAKMQEEAQKQWFDLKVNTSVYITGLPDDISEAQLAEVRSRAA